MDGKNKAMKTEPYTYTVKDWKTKQQVEKTVDAYSMFDINKTLMRCLVKNLAMFGLALYIFSGEDLPEVEPEVIDTEPMLNAIMQAASLEELKTVYFGVVKMTKGNQEIMRQMEKAKDDRKNQLTGAA
jgi:hypothetical protein